MILTPYARVIYTSTGTVQNYNVPFPYLDFDHIHIYAIDPNTRKRTTEYAIDQWVTGSCIRPAAVPPSGQKFMIERVTPRDAALVDFADGAVIEAEDLDISTLQNLYICEEIIDELEWTGNEVSLLWTAHNALLASHTNLSQAVTELREWLEETYAIANRGLNIALCVRSWLKPWYEQFIPAISLFINLTIVDGGTAGTIDEIYCIVDGDIDPDEYDDAIIYDGGSSADYHFAWTPEAIKLIKAYDIAEQALCTAKKASRMVECAHAMAVLVYNSDPFIIDAGGADEMLEFDE